MSERTDPLYSEGPGAGAKAKILLIHFDGAIDAGGAGRMAIEQMLRSLRTERVATFDPDAFMDYRSHRPIVSVDNWVSSMEMTMPETLLDLVEDDMGNPILVLHGAEPDARWETFARTVADICEKAGVEITFALHGVPSGVPHTRPTPVHVQATDASLLPAQGQMGGRMQFPAPLSTFLQIRLQQRGMGGLALLGAVPYYMAESPYPAASSALLSSFGTYADLSLPVGDLEQGAAQDQENIAKLVDDNPEIAHTVASLEEHFDAWRGGEGAIPLEGSGARFAQQAQDKTSKDIGDVIEAYLAQVSRTHDEEGRAESSDGEDAPPAPSRPDTLEDVLARVEARRRGESGGPSAPRHRA